MKLKDAVEVLSQAVATGDNKPIVAVGLNGEALLVRYADGTEAQFRLTQMHAAGVCKYCKKVLDSKERAINPTACPRCMMEYE